MMSKHAAPEDTLSPKVAVGAASATAAGAAVTIAVWIATMNGLDVPAEVATAATVLVTAAGGFLGGWLKRDPLRSSEGSSS